MTKKPSKEEFDLVIEAIRYEYKNKPINLSLRLPTILNMPQSFASSEDREGIYVLFEISKHTELKNIHQDHICSIISWLELVEKVLKDKSPFTYLPSQKPMTIPKTMPNDPSRFLLKIFDAFDNWYAAYIVKRDSGLENLSLLNLEKICYLVHDIEEKFELNPNEQIIIKLTTNSIDAFPLLREKCSINSDIIPYREEALEYLKNHNIISHYEIKHYECANSEVGMLLDVEEFIKFKTELKTIYINKCKKLEGKKKPKCEIELPPNTKWEDITIKFVNGNDVDIKIKDKTIRSDFRQMGFEDTKRRLPNQQWSLLETLAGNNGEISWNNSEATVKLKKRKQLLAQTLKAYFSIDEDPFFPYKQEQAYKIRINLFPE